MRLLAIGFAARDLTQFDVLAALCLPVRYPDLRVGGRKITSRPFTSIVRGVNSCSASRGRRLPFAALR
jgi:hypothetical protein